MILTLDGGSRQVLARNQEREGDGGTSNTVVHRWEGLFRSPGGGAPSRRWPPSSGAPLVVCPGEVTPGEAQDD